MPPSVSVSETPYLKHAPAATTSARISSRSSVLVALFATTLFVSAFLMFLVEPMIARMVLPQLGGAPAVWNTCLVFFQFMLLAGYAYAHGATRWLGVRRHIVVHSVILLMPLLVLPIGLRQAPPASSQSPIGWLLLALGGSIGLPFFVLSTSAAVLQKWFSATDDESAGDPYFLYAASNLGSFIALLAYPLAVEPTLRLQDQARLWTAGYALLVALSLVCAAAVWRRGRSGDGALRTAAAAEAAQPISWARRARWIALAFVPSSLLLAVTSYISTDVASVPLLWIVPLSLYLLTFVIAFSHVAQRVGAVASRLMPLVAILLALAMLAGMTSPLAVVIPLHLVVFLVIAIVCHADLAHDRPSSARLTEFYFWIAFGGMLGGLFNALLAPVIFSGIAEYPLVLVAACLLRRVPASDKDRTLGVADVAIPLAIGAAVAVSVLVNNRFGSMSRFMILGASIPAVVAFGQQRHRYRFAASIALILLAGNLTRTTFGHAVFTARTFFGVNRVMVDESRGYRFIFHGTTLHGMQSLDPRRSGEPTSYFHRMGPVGQVFAAVPEAKATPDVAGIGLGVGTLAAYRAPGQRWTYYEIDPVVERIARNDAYFTYLSACGDRCTVITGDGRVSLGRAEPHKYGVIIIDAFSSDAVPMHLITKEAMALYLSKLAPGGVIVYNISNMHLSFSSVLARIGEDAGLATLWQREPPTAGSWQTGKFPSEWFVFARDRHDFGPLLNDARWKAPVASAGTPLWTDDFSNILSVIRHDGE
jgi:spermidine synthase